MTILEWDLKLFAVLNYIHPIGEQLRIIEEKDAKLQEEALQLKSRLNSCKESKAEEVANLKVRESFSKELKKKQFFFVC